MLKGIPPDSPEFRECRRRAKQWAKTANKNYGGFLAHVRHRLGNPSPAARHRLKAIWINERNRRKKRGRLPSEQRLAELAEQKRNWETLTIAAENSTKNWQALLSELEAEHGRLTKRSRKQLHAVYLEKADSKNSESRPKLP